MNINRLKQLEKRLSKKLDFVDERSKWMFPIKCSVKNRGLYYITKWQNGEFADVASTEEDLAEYRKDHPGPVIFIPVEENGGH